MTFNAETAKRAAEQRAVGRKPVEIGAQQAEMLEKAPALCISTLDRAYRHQASPTGAIKAKCLDCCNYDRAEITACQVLRCPLHAYRPYQKGA